MKKRIVAVLMVAVMVLSLTACGNTRAESEEKTMKISDDARKILGV